MKRLSPDIVIALAKKLGKKESTVKSDIYRMSSSYPSSTKNAVGQIYARKHGETVYRLLDADDRISMPNLAVEKPVVKIVNSTRKLQKERITQFIKLTTTESFKRDHVDEINRCYTHKCYTACFVLCRKVIENMVIDVLRAKYPTNIAGDLDIYFDAHQGRYRDFSVLLRNLSQRSGDFGPDSKLVDRIVSLTDPFKKDANDKAHSWFHVVKNREELDKLQIQDIIDFLTVLQKNLSS